MPADRSRLIRFAEYTAVLASVAGAIATIKTQKPAYAALPLSVAATLSLVSRHQQSQQVDATIAASQEAQTLALKIQQVNQRLDVIGQQGRERHQRLDNLSQTTTRQQNETAEVAQLIATLQSSVEQQQKRLVELEGRRSPKLIDRLEQVQQQVSAALQNIQSDLADLSKRTETAINKQNAYLTQAQQQSSQQHTIADSQVTQLDERVTSLHSDFESFRRELTELTLQLQEQAAQTTTDLNKEEKSAATFSHLIPQLPTEDNFDLDINLGIDFGTGYTKVCFRDLARDRSEVVTFAEPTQGQLNLAATLMPTRLAILTDGTLLTGLTEAEWEANDKPIQKQIDYIKMRLAAIDLRQQDKENDWRLEQIPELDDDTTVESLCAYYLSRVITRSQQWIAQNRPDLFTNQTVRWSVNIGVPVEYCDSPALKRFEKVLALAWLLKSTDIDASALNIEQLNQLIEHLQQWMDNNKTMNELDCTTTPEIVAAMWSFINSRQAQEGFYTFFDIGDGTLDGAAFIFRRDDGERQVDCYIGQVEPLGVSAFVEKTASELNQSTSEVRQSLGTESTLLQAQMQQSSTRKSIQKMVANVVMSGNEKHSQIEKYLVAQDIGENLRVFVGGGGSNTAFFPQTIQATHGDFNQGSADIPAYEIKQIPAPTDLATNGLDQKDFNRFAIAYGLCIPEGEGPSIQLPSQFDNIESGAEIVDHRPDRYEDSRDLM